MAQVTTGAIVGVVRDQSGAVVGRAQVSATNQGTGIRQETTSDSEGLYSFRELPIGIYFVEVTSTGFRTLKKGPITLASTQQLEVNADLSPGATQETVDVTAEGQLLQTQESAVKSQVTQTQVEDLPLNGRNPSALILLGPSVSVALQASTGSSLGYTFNGQNQNGGSLRLDGLDASIGTDPGFLFGSLNFNLNTTSVDSIAEFDIQTDNYSAESKGSSGYVNVITKSGTNKVHFDFYDYFRNGAMDGTNFFAKSRGSLKQNDFGGTMSGPIKKNKAFFMGSYEGQRIHQPYPGFAVVPTASFRSTVNSALQPFLNATPLPTSPIPGNADAGDFQDTVKSNIRQDIATGRVDYNFSEKDRIFARYVINYGVVGGASSALGGTVNNGLSIFPGYNFNQSQRHQDLSVDWAHTFTPTFVNDLKLGMNRYRETRLRGDQSIYLLPDITVPGVTISGGGNRKHWGTTEGELDDKATWVHGKSTLSFGGNYTYWVSGLNQFSVPVLTFPNLDAFAADQPTIVSDGLGASGHEPTEHIHNTQFAGFVQEDYRLSPNLTLNFGLRYDNYGVFVDSAQNARNVIDGPYSDFRPAGDPLYNRNNADFGPRFGFAWQPLKATPFVLRGGIGIYYGERTTGETGDIFEYNSVGGFSVSNIQFPGLTYPIPDDVYTFAAGRPGRHIMDPNSKDLATQQWNLTAQYQLGQATSLSVGYVANHQTHIPGETLVNVIDPFTGMLQNPAFGGNISYIQTVDTAYYNSLQTSFRHRLSHNIAWDTYYTWSHDTGLETGLFEASAAVGGGHEQVQTYANRNLNRYNMPVDLRHQFTTDLTYMLPALGTSSGLVRNVLGGWSTSGILKAASGLPFNIFTGGDTGDGTFEQRPNLTGQPIYLEAGAGRGFLNPAAFSVPTAVDPTTGLRLGYLPNNYVHLPFALTMDWGLSKKFYPSERFNVEFRAEAFNILNHPVFSSVVGTLSAPNFGQAQGASDPRELQMSLKFNF